MKQGFYVELEDLKKDDPEASFGFLENMSVTSESNAYNFLHGCCDEFVAMLSEMYGYGIECVRNAEGRLIHAYCITEVDGEKAYIDVRGTTTDPVLFFEEFDNELSYYPKDDSIVVMNDELYEMDAEVEIWKSKDEFFDGEYEGWTDADIKNFIRDQGSYYNPNKVREGIFAKQMFFHVTLMENVESIREKGLLPQIGERSEEFGETEKAIYLFTSYEAMDNALMNWLGEWYNEVYGENCELAVLKVMVPPEIEIMDEGVGYEVVCKERIPSDYIEFFDELGNEIRVMENIGQQAETEISLYRYELYCDGEYQDVGFLSGLEDIGLPIDEETKLLQPFDKELVNPCHPQMSRSVSFFTEKGMEKFNEAIRDLVLAYEGSIFDVKLITLKLPVSMMEKMIYKDEDQVCLSKEFYKELTRLKKAISEPVFVKNIKEGIYESLEQKIYRVVEKKDVPEKKNGNDIEVKIR